MANVFVFFVMFILNHPSIGSLDATEKKHNISYIFFVYQNNNKITKTIAFHRSVFLHWIAHQTKFCVIFLIQIADFLFFFGCLTFPFHSILFFGNWQIISIFHSINWFSHKIYWFRLLQSSKCSFFVLFCYNWIFAAWNTLMNSRYRDHWMPY